MKYIANFRGGDAPANVDMVRLNVHLSKNRVWMVTGDHTMAYVRSKQLLRAGHLTLQDTLDKLGGRVNVLIDIKSPPSNLLLHSLWNLIRSNLKKSTKEKEKKKKFKKRNKTADKTENETEDEDENVDENENEDKTENETETVDKFDANKEYFKNDQDFENEFVNIEYVDQKTKKESKAKEKAKRENSREISKEKTREISKEKLENRIVKEEPGTIKARERKWEINQFHLISYNGHTVDGLIELRKLQKKKFRIGFITNNHLDDLSLTAINDIDFIVFDANICDDETVKMVRQSFEHLEIMVASVNNIQAIKKYKNFGVDAIISDQSQLFNHTIATDDSSFSSSFSDFSEFSDFSDSSSD